MSAEQYSYYVQNPIRGFIGNDTTWIILIGHGNKNETLYLLKEMQRAYEFIMDEDNKLNLTDDEIKFAFIEPRYDEPLTEAFQLRRWPTLYVIDPVFGKAHAWDKYEWANNVTLREWVLSEEYKNSHHIFPAPSMMTDEEMQWNYVLNWFRANFGGRFCWWVYKVPGLKYVMFLFCDHNQTDLHRQKEDRFTIIAAPPTVIFVGLPLLWKALKFAWGCIIWCC
jgi:hypothetical protein